MPQRLPGTVFLVDDDEAVRDSLKLLLESYMLEVREFASALDLLQALGPRPTGCLVLDLHLPVISGLDFLSLYRGRLNGMPVILITGKSDPATRARAFEAGVDDVFEKPFKDNELVTAIIKALSGCGANG